MPHKERTCLCCSLKKVMGEKAFSDHVVVHWKKLSEKGAASPLSSLAGEDISESQCVTVRCNTGKF